MTVKHTPGPWQGCLHLRDNADETCGCGYVGGVWSLTDDVMICEMGPYGPGSEMIPVPEREIQKANARLIAAAPDLLEALKLVLQHGRIDNSEERMNVVSAAIAKATGK